MVMGRHCEWCGNLDIGNLDMDKGCHLSWVQRKMGRPAGIWTGQCVQFLGVPRQRFCMFPTLEGSRSRLWQFLEQRLV